MHDTATIRAKRNLLALLLASLVYGVIAAPWFWLGVYALVPPFREMLLVGGPWIAADTAVLLLMFIARTRLEEALALRLGRWFRPLALAVAALALAQLWLTESTMPAMPLAPEVEYWSSLVSVSGGAAVVALAICAATPRSRLERVIASRLSRGKRSNALYRAVAILALMSVLVFASYQLYRFYLYSTYCVGYLEWGWERCHEEFGILHF